MRLLIRTVLLWLVIFSFSDIYSQENPEAKKEKKPKKEKVKLEHADEIEGFPKLGINKFRGNVVFKQKSVFLYCDSATQFEKEYRIEAYGRVKITQGDTLTLTGDRLTYYSDIKKAILTGNVVFQNKGTTLTTQNLEYNLKSKQAFYKNGGTINDGNSTLTSDEGYYNTESKLFRFKNNVRVVNPSKGFTLESDTLHYNTGTKIATFKGPSKIETPNGIINADHGTYNTVTGVMDAKGTAEQAQVVSGKYTLTADHIDYNKITGIASARGNVRLISTKDQIIVEGDRAYHWEKRGFTKIFDNAVMKSIVNGDTLFLTADTLIFNDSPDSTKKRLVAYNHTKIFKSDLQGKCDSLIYQFLDSTIYFFRVPILWSGENQITADSINIKLKNNEIHTLNLRTNSFIISKDTLSNYNQVKGRNMTSYFTKGNIVKIDVDGNGESIYHAIENEKVLIGMNKVICSNMIIRMDSNKVKSISFIKKPDGKFIPPHEIQEPERKLKGFIWKEEERPSRSDIYDDRRRN